MTHSFTALAIALMLSTLSSSVYASARSYDGWTSTYSRSSPLRACPKHCELITTSSQVYGVPSSLILAIIKQESNFNANAQSHKGAKGLMQLMDMNSTGIDPFNPKENIERGTALLSRLLGQYDSIELALAAYNAGEGNVRKYGGIPPFKETRNYIKKVMHYYQGYQ
ncbi:MULTISPECIES: lytic transglycosylase domain-containing protein [Aliivibrio]|uniref:lytic transglycosylase domain-containing protein n=1 Tax=Aliivibrio TaxID=511678 RepID=UPI0015F7B2DB|nr:lytic transglycosylase domain-containing protein [Aliivibrio sp. SR45-2]MBB1313466.1 lytic transglycosylase domain-containing protein [Aliivibrio sp. SR45-2]